jgi:hypothetical protein
LKHSACFTFGVVWIAGDHALVFLSKGLAWISSATAPIKLGVEIHVPVTRSILSSEWLRGWFTWNLVPRKKGCRSRLCFSRHAGRLELHCLVVGTTELLVAWARQCINLSGRLATVRMFVTMGETFASVVEVLFRYNF